MGQMDAHVRGELDTLHEGHAAIHTCLGRNEAAILGYHARARAFAVGQISIKKTGIQKLPWGNGVTSCHGATKPNICHGATSQSCHGATVS